MTDEDDSSAYSYSKPGPLRKMNKKTKVVYMVLLAVTIAVVVIATFFGRFSEIIIAIPIIILLISTLVLDKEIIHVPPLLITFVVCIMLFSLIARYFKNDVMYFDIITSFLSGMVLCSMGLIIAYMALGKMPGFANERPGLIAVEAFSLGLALFLLWTILLYYISQASSDFPRYSMEVFIGKAISITAGSFVTAIAFFAGNHNSVLRGVVTRFLTSNYEIVGMEQNDAEETVAMIKGGESDSLEFKSTLRKNLKTGEKDERMEKAVLKSIVAFLNTSGGTLLVGVADDGEIIGADVELFDSLDRMNLHVNNLIKSQIGSEFIPFIRFRQINYGKREDGMDRIVIRFDCKPTTTPVFLKDKKEQIFYVRSGPSSVEIVGPDLINYVNNRNKAYKRKYSAAKKQPIKEQFIRIIEEEE